MTGLPPSANLPRPPIWRHPALAYAGVFAATMVAVVCAFQLWRVNLGAPLNYEGDAIQHLVFAKAFVENGWYLHNPYLGAPGEMDLREFPAADTLPGLIIKFLGLFTHQPALLDNLLFLLSFPLTSLAAFFVCRRMDLSALAAAFVALLYAFLPYHLWRNEGHLYLSCYFVVPFAVLVGWWIATGRLLNPSVGGGTRRLIFASFLCLLVATSGAYYPFFSGLLLGLACLYALAARRDWRHGLAGGFLLAVLLVGLLACLSSSILYAHSHPHPPVSQRGAEQSEIYGLKIAQLFLPTNNHRLAAFRAINATYSLYAPLVTENASAALGIAGALGCLLLLGWLLLRPRFAVRAAGQHETLDVLSGFNVSAILWGTIGGFGSLFAYYVTPQFRGLNRISVFIGFFSLTAIGVCFDGWCRTGLSFGKRTAITVLLALATVACLFDQIPPADIAYYKSALHNYRADHIFFQQVQHALPAHAMVFELPYEFFPESGLTQHMQDSSLFRGYLHTEGIRWSYGATHRSAADMWQENVAALPLPDTVHELALAGFGGVFLERAGFADNGDSEIIALQNLLGPPIAVRDLRLCFSLADYTQTLRASMSPAIWQEEAEAALHPAFAQFGPGFYNLETDGTLSWRWCGPEGHLTVLNTASHLARVRLRFSAHTGGSDTANLVATGPGFRQVCTIQRAGQPLEWILNAPPGQLDLVFSCDGHPVDAPRDPRVMTWNMTNFQLETLGPVPAVPPDAGQAR